jgi:DNA polymerase
MHADTEIISCAFKLGSAKTVVAFGEHDVRVICDDVDWSEYMVVGHNLSGFDAMILSWRLGIKPKMWGCTLAMARPVHAKDVGLSLGKLVTHYGIGVKNNSALLATKGKNLCDFTQQELDDMAIYNAADVDQCAKLFARLIPHTNNDELGLIDMTIRMLIEPQFDVDIPLLVNTLADEDARKDAMLLQAAKILGVYDPSLPNQDIIKAASTVLMSASKFGKFLTSLNVPIPTKVSPSDPTKLIPALAKTDEDFLALLDHSNPLVVTAAEARLDAKSTILQTRIQAFIDAAKAHPTRKVPIPLKYYGADTTGRWSGWGYNPQNLPRVPRDAAGNIIFKPSNALRQSLVAPPGHKVVVADLSGIELRVNHFLWQVPSSMAMYQASPDKADLYKDFASKLYGVSPAQVTTDQRQVGKVAHLGLGFGAGHVTFQKVAKLMGGVDITEQESLDIVSTWRSEYSEIKKGWRTCHAALTTILKGATGAAIDPCGMVYPIPEGLKTPKGIIRYPDLRIEYDDNNRPEFVYGHGRSKARIYAGKIDENIVQHLARCVMADNALAVRRRTGLLPALMVHDELVYVVREKDAQSTLDIVQNIMRTPPLWWPELVTWSKGDIADTYGDAK